MFLDAIIFCFPQCFLSIEAGKKAAQLFTPHLAAAPAGARLSEDDDPEDVDDSQLDPKVPPSLRSFPHVFDIHSPPAAPSLFHCRDIWGCMSFMFVVFLCYLC